MLAPGLGDCLKLNISWQAADAYEMIAHCKHFLGVHRQAALFIDHCKLFVGGSAVDVHGLHS